MDPSTSFKGDDWQLGCAASRLIADGSIRAPLIVMIDNAGTVRYAEYADTTLGEKYREWVAGTLKPTVDAQWATLSGPADTFSMGSSMGGLVSFLCCWRQPGVFGGAACLSPVFQAPLLAEVAFSGWEPRRDFRLYIDNGGDTLGALVQIDSWRLEDHFWGRLDTQLQPGVDAMLVVLRGRRNVTLDYHRAAGAAHDEQAWARRSWRPLLHLLGKNR
jgi:pimeloyl-ACP methyl ester carboxylesterase